MRLRIHHGAAEIGGNCIELESGGKSLLLDLGLPLQRAPTLPDIPGLVSPDADLLGVILSHPHLDHYGLLPLARADLPVWLGEGALRMLSAAAPFASGSTLPQTVTAYHTGEVFQVGPFSITPYLMDHSAYDAHALLVEAEGKRVLYTGDFRGHGRKAATFEQFLAHPPGMVDILVMEGTTLGRTEAPVSERDVEDKAQVLMRAASGLVLTCFSGQNIDRFVTFFRAGVRSNRVFVIDAYMANLIMALDLSTMPNPMNSSSLRVFLPKSQKRMILTSKRFDLIDWFRARRIYSQELFSDPKKFAVMFRSSMIPDFAGKNLAGGCAIYSLWPGYLQRDRTDLRQWVNAAGAAFHIVHSSGHACSIDLQRMAAAIRPRRLVPIHSAHPEIYSSLFSHVQSVPNGEWTTI